MSVSSEPKTPREAFFMAVEFVLKRSLEANLVFGVLSALAVATILDKTSENTFAATWFWFVGVGIVLTVCWLIRVAVFRIVVESTKRMDVMVFIAFIESCAFASMLIWFHDASLQTRALLGLVLLTFVVRTVMSTSGHQPLFLAAIAPIIMTSVVVFFDIVFAFTDPLSQAAVYVYLIFVIGVWLTFSLQRLAFKISTNIFSSLKVNSNNQHINRNLRAAVLSAKQANESKTRFLASASHDLRQPINSLALFIASLQLQSETPEQQGIVGSMAEAIESINSQLESLLDISKLDAGIVEVHAQRINLVSVLSHIVETYQVQCTHSGTVSDFGKVPIELLIDDKTLFVNTDPALFDRVVRNLVGNAVKYTPVGRIRVSLRQRQSSAVVTIQDNGIGIGSTELKQVFEEFYQVNNPQRDAQQGLGLGLSIVKRLCELLEIKVLFRSKLGAGTVIELSLPISDEPSKPVEPSALRPLVQHTGSSLRVLVLDNEPTILVAMYSVLTRMGHKVKTVTNATEAIKEFTAFRYDLALVDYRLPGEKTGVDVIKQFSKLDPHVKSFLVTGDGSIKESLSAINIIYKPLTPEKLATVFAQLRE